MTDRVPGFYWVQDDGGHWIIAEWDRDADQAYRWQRNIRDRTAEDGEQLRIGPRINPPAGQAKRLFRGIVWFFAGVPTVVAVIFTVLQAWPLVMNLTAPVPVVSRATYYAPDQPQCRSVDLLPELKKCASSQCSILVQRDHAHGAPGDDPCSLHVKVLYLLWTCGPGREYAQTIGDKTHEALDQSFVLNCATNSSK